MQMTPALAANECGIAAGATVICAGASYPTGIAYDTDALGHPTTLTLNNPAMAVTRLGGVDAVQLTNLTLTGGAVINLDAFSSITSSGDYGEGVYAYIAPSSSTGVATVRQSGGGISTSGKGAEGIFVRNSGLGAGNVDIQGGSITTTGDDAEGARVQLFTPTNTATATVTLNGGDISTAGNGAEGLLAETEGLGEARVNVQSGSISTTGNESHGAYAYLGNAASTSTAEIIQTGGSITTGGARAIGIGATARGTEGAARVFLQNGSITTTGESGTGARAQANGATATATASVLMASGNISTAGLYASGLAAFGAGGGATVLLQGGTVSTAGNLAFGARASVLDTTSTATALAFQTGGMISTAGGQAHGLLAEHWGQGAAETTLRGGSVVTAGDAARGAFSHVSGASATATALVTLDGGDITTNGNFAHGLQALNEGFGAATVNINGGTITTANISGTASNAALAEVANADSTAAATVTMTDGAITTGSLGHNFGSGLVALNAGQGEAAVNVEGGTVTVQGEENDGARARISNTTSTSAATITVTGGSIEVSRSNAYGLRALNEGLGAALVDISDGYIAATGGNNTDAVRAQVSNTDSSAAAMVTMTGGTVSSGPAGGGGGLSGLGSGGIIALNEGLGAATVNIGNGTITGDIYGVKARISNADSTAVAAVTMAAGSVSTSGVGAEGLLALNQGQGQAQVEMNGGSIATAGDHSEGAYAEVSDRFIVDGSTSTAAATVRMTDGAISTAGSEASGIRARNQGLGTAIVTVEGGSINTTGAASHGAYAHISNASSTAAVAATQRAGDIVTTGASSSGLMARNDGRGDAIVSVEGGSILSTGAGGNGAQAFVSSSFSSPILSQSGGSVVATGMNADGFLVGSNLTTGPAAYVVSLTGGSVTGGAGNGAAIHTFAVTPIPSFTSTGTITIDPGATVIAGGSGIAIRDGDITKDGVDEVEAASNASVSINGGSVTGNVILGYGDDTVTLAGGSLDGDIYGDDPTASVNDGDDTFTWTGGTWGSSFYGGNGSDVVNISTLAYGGTHHVLDGGDDYSNADGWIDRLTLTGVNTDVLGANLVNWEQLILDGGNLRITDGALHVGDGISLFSGVDLSGGGVLDGGAALALTGNLFLADAGTRFDITGGGVGSYSVSGSVVNHATIAMQDSATGDALAVAGDYAGNGALTIDIDTASDTLDTLVIDGDVFSGSGSTTIFVNNLSPLAATGNSLTVVSVGGSADAGAFTLDGGFLSAGLFDYALEQNASDFILRGGLNPTAATYSAAPAVLSGFNHLPSLKERTGGGSPAAGGRAGARTGSWARLHTSRFNTELTTGDSFVRAQYGAQAGLDLTLDPGANGQAVVGFTMQYGTLSSSVQALLGSGTISATGFGLGASATWYGYDGTYVDVQGQVNRLRADMSSSRDGALVSGHAVTAISLSLEAGRAIRMSDTAVLTPQAQLSWGSIQGGSFVDALGDTITLGRNNSLIGRLGLAYEVDHASNSGNRFKGYVIGNILHDFSTDTSVDMAGTTLTAGTQATWAELSLGGSIDFGQGNSSVYGEAAYSVPLGGGAGASNRGLRLSAGLRMEF